MIVVLHSYISVKAKPRIGLNLKAARSVAIGTALSHVKYIQHRPGKDLQPGQGGREVFTDTQESADSKELRKIIRDYESRGVVIHKLTLSPEVSPNDPKEFTREVMQQLGSDKGLDLGWWAVTHDNTDHRHIHVVVLPKDKDGRVVLFNRDDYKRLKEFGDRYLERTQYSDCRVAEFMRQEKQRELSKEQRQRFERERQERIQNGEELPWLHKKIVREQLEPYREWSKDQPRDPKECFEYRGETYSRKDGYERLAGLRRHLYENTDKSQRLPKEDYKRLSSWIEERIAAASPAKLIASLQTRSHRRPHEMKREIRQLQIDTYHRCSRK